MADQVLRLIITGSSSGATKEMKKLQRDMDTVARNVTSLGKSLTMGVTVPVLAVSAGLVKLGMAAVESENLFTVSMGDMADEARKWSEDLSDALGLNEYELRKNVGMLNTMLGSMGLATDASYDMATSLVELAYDMSSFYDLKPEEAFLKLRSGITGEVEPLKQLGIIVNETTVKTYALKTGLIKAGETMTDAQKVTARYGAIMEQTSKAQGDLARTMDSPANKLRRLKEEGTETAIKFGTLLLPTLEDLVDVGEEVVGWLDELSPAQKQAVIDAALLAAAAGPVILGLGKIATAAAAVHKAYMVMAGAQVVSKLAGLVPLLNGVAAGTAAIGTAATITAPQLALIGALGFGAYKAGQQAGEAVVNAFGKGGDAAETAIPKIANCNTAIVGTAEGTVALADAMTEAKTETVELTRAMEGQMVASDELSGKTRTLAELENDAKTAKLDLKDAHKEYDEAVAVSGKNSDAAQRALLRLEDAEFRASDAAADLKVKVDEYGMTAAEAAADLRLEQMLNRVRIAAEKAASAGREFLALKWGGSGRQTGGIMQNAEGSIVTRPTLTWVGEAGATESIISWDPRKRMRSLDIWQETGKALGVQSAGGGDIYNVNLNVKADEIGDVVSLISRIKGSRVSLRMAGGEA